MAGSPEIDKEVYLTSAADIVEAEIKENLLRAEGIPVIIKHRDNGAFMAIYTGNTLFGVDLYVPLRFYDKAKEILDAEIEYPEDINGAGEDEDNPDSSADNTGNGRSIAFQLFIVVLFIVMIIKIAESLT